MLEHTYTPRIELTWLSVGERDVLDDAAEGMTVRESAIHREKGSETVKTQRRSVLLKLGARNMAQAVAIMAASRVAVGA
jgi:DNA-binding CsgD family transcriptional regulator